MTTTTPANEPLEVDPIERCGFLGCTMPVGHDLVEAKAVLAGRVDVVTVIGAVS